MVVFCDGSASSMRVVLSELGRYLKLADFIMKSGVRNVSM